MVPISSALSTVPAIKENQKGYMVADDLCRTLSTYSSLASLITKLQLGIEIDGEVRAFPLRSVSGSRTPTIQLVLYGTRTHIQILQLCPNVEHVDIRGFNSLELGALVDELGKKSLLYFSISALKLSSAEWRGRNKKSEGRVSHILGLMRKWPKLRSIQADGFLDAEMTEAPVALDESEVSGCCTDLREIIITCAALHPDMYRALRIMCSGGITKLSVSLSGRSSGSSGNAAADALCRCLRVWSPTLAYLKIDIVGNDDRDSYHPLIKAISTLGELRGLQFDRMKLEFGAISKLPRLERLAYLPHYSSSKEDSQALSSLREDMEKFPLLNLIVHSLTIDSGLTKICWKRKIELASDSERTGRSPTTDFLL